MKMTNAISLILFVVAANASAAAPQDLKCLAVVEYDDGPVEATVEISNASTHSRNDSRGEEYGMGDIRITVAADADSESVDEKFSYETRPIKFGPKEIAIFQELGVDPRSLETVRYLRAIAPESADLPIGQLLDRDSEVVVTYLFSDDKEWLCKPL